MDNFNFNFEDEPTPEFGETSEPETLSPDSKPLNTQSDFDKEFSALVAGYEADQEVLRNATSVLEAEQVILTVEAERAEKEIEYAAVTEEVSEAEAELAAIEKEYLAKRRIVEEAKRRRSALTAEASSIRANQREAERLKREKQKALELAKDAVRIRAKRVEERSNYLTVAKDKAWWNGVDGDKILDHQWTGAQFLAASGRSILGDGMGLGKTLTSIAALDLVDSKKALVIAQGEIASNFETEIRKWAPHRFVVNMAGMGKAERNNLFQMINILDNAIVVINYESWRKDRTLLERLISVGFDSVILDEAHNIKNKTTNGYEGVHTILTCNNVCPKCEVVMPPVHDSNGNLLPSVVRKCVKCDWNGQAWEMTFDHEVTYEEQRELKYWATKSVKNLWCVTGTPILNKPHDLFSLLSIISPIHFDNQNAFLREYCLLNQYDGKWGFRPGGADYLMKHRLNGKYLARNLEDAGITLPPQHPIVHDIVMDTQMYPGQAKVIKELTDHAQLILSSGAKLPAIEEIALLTRQRQANVWPGGITWTVTDPLTQVETLVRVSEEIQESIKMDKAISIIADAIEQGHRVVLFSQFKSALAELQTRINGMELENGHAVRSIRYDGDTKDADKMAIKTNFDKKRGEKAKWDVLLANYRVGGTGLNLTGATTTILLDREWNGAKEDQALARTRRMGQTETTFVHDLRLVGTVDVWLDKLIDTKRKMVAGFEASAESMQEAWLKAHAAGEFNIDKE